MFFLAAGCSTQKSEFEIVHAEELSAARALLQDRRSRRVFDASVRMHALADPREVDNLIALGQFRHPRLADFRQYFHPLVTVNPGYTVIDAGAVGPEPILTFAYKVGDGGRVIGFEPNPRAMGFTRNLLKEHNIQNVELHLLALYSKQGTMALHLPSYCSTYYDGGASLIQPPPGGGTSSVEVEVITLDDFVIKHGIDRVDFIKMDIEGAEMAALRGMENVLRRYKPNLAISAYHFPQCLFEIILWLDSLDLGYKFWFDNHYSDSGFGVEKMLYAKSPRRPIN